MEENKEVVEETTQETVNTVDETKFDSAGDDSVIKVDLKNPPKKQEMPFQSKAQMRFLYATNPKLAEKFRKKTKKSLKKLPEKIKKKSPKKFLMNNPLLKKLLMKK
tara:strand:- start:330 stop:647 length:318 start_codon:yes stop_codon:yes gene_type:complete